VRKRIAALSFAAAVVYGCASSTPPPAVANEMLSGVASWYGEEFAGRTTANGEIFDPLLLTAAHRTLPFGTIVDVTNPKTNQTVRVRVNDRGPYIGNRVIDLSYAAAQQIGLIDPGIGEVQIHVIEVGRGDREPPAPFSVTVAEAPKTAPQVAAGDAPAVPFPIPVTPEATPEPPKQVAENGTAIVQPPAPEPPKPRAHGGFVVQVGAFSVEANAKLLMERLARIGQEAFVDSGELWRVRIGPFATRDAAMKTRATLEANGISAIIVNE
jgi:rare lipoprotein A